jgi:transketolase
MAIRNSACGDILTEYTIDDLTDAARLMRGHALVALCAAGSGHSGGTLSIMDITAALYLRVADHDPRAPDWADRDRIIWSAGHKAPSLYLGLAFAGFFPIEDVVLLRKLGSPFQGHPHWPKLPGIEASTGSLGQGLSLGVGVALAGKLRQKAFKVFCIMGDGEQQEGQIWEAAMEASHHHLDNLIGIVDCNGLQIDGAVSEVMNVDPLEEKYRSFGWSVLRVDGHDMGRVVDALERAKRAADGPTVVLADTVKGKGVSFMENSAGWHGRSPTYEEMQRGLAGLGVAERVPADRLLDKARAFQTAATAALDARMPKFTRDFWWNASDAMRVSMSPTRLGFGDALEEHGDDERVVCLGLDISDSISISQFHRARPERRRRWISMGIAEQSATSAAAGLAREGFLPVLGTYGTFAAARNLDQIRISVCYANVNVLLAGAHGGVSVGPDGATHQALEDLFAVCGLPNMSVVVPCDTLETRKATSYLLLEHVGPKYLRFAREATPVVTDESTPFVFGKANIVRLRRLTPTFAAAFETVVASAYEDEHEDLSIVACGPMVPEAMRAAWILKQDFGHEVRIINMHTLKPLDESALVRAARETGLVLTAEEHQKGALAWRVSNAITESAAAAGALTGAVGVMDRFGESGAPWELIKVFELSAEHIAHKALVLLALKPKR